MKLQIAALILTGILPTSAYASETCVKYMEADAEFRSIYSAYMSGSQEDDYFDNVFVPALRKYGDSYMDAYPGGRKSKDDKINLELAATWRNVSCPGVSRWDATVSHFWTLFVYMDENARIQLACRRLIGADQEFIRDYPTDKSDSFYKGDVKFALRDYAGEYIEHVWGLGFRWVSSDDSEEEALKKVIEFRESNCSGPHNWTDENFAHWKKVRRKK